MRGYAPMRDYAFCDDRAHLCVGFLHGGLDHHDDFCLLLGLRHHQGGLAELVLGDEGSGDVSGLWLWYVFLD